MRSRRSIVLAICSVALAGVVFASLRIASTHQAGMTEVTLQLKWVTQAQFAGYYAAKAKGFYKDAGLDVNIKVGGPDIVPEQVVLGGQAEFGIDWLASLLANRDTGHDLVNIGQVYTRSGKTEVTFKDSGIDAIQQMKGKKYGVWIFGIEFEQEAALVKAGLDPKKDVTLVKQTFDMVAFLKRQLDAASAMTYKELAQVLESKNPRTGKLYQLSELNVFKMSDLGTEMLQDGVFVKGSWITSAAHQVTAVKFLEASFRGWVYCRDHVQECVDIVLAEDTALQRGDQTWQMNEVSALIWPNRLGVGVMDPDSFRNTASIAYKFKVIKKPATTAAYRSDFAQQAIAALEEEGIDVYGESWRKAVVKLTEGGK